MTLLLTDAGPAELLAPGLPDLLLGARGGLAWAGREGLFLWRPGLARHIPLGELTQLQATANGWRALSAAGPTRCRIIELDDQGQISAQIDLRAPRRELSMGQGLAWLSQPSTKTAFSLPSGGPARLPLGAEEGLLAVAPDAPCWLWADEGYLYRRGPAGTWLAGRYRGKARHLVAGPQGVGLLATDERLFLLPRQGALIELDPDLALDSLRFSSDGAVLLARSGPNLRRVGTDEGATLGERAATDPLPLDADGEGLWLEEADGCVFTFAGDKVRGGFLPTSPALFAGTLYGPAACAWDLRSGATSPPNPGLIAEELLADDDGVIGILGDRVSISGPQGEERGGFTLPPEIMGEGVIEAGRAGGQVLVRTSAGCFALDPLFELAMPSAEEPPAPAEVGLDPALFALGAELGADSGVCEGDRGWLWTDDGALFRAALPIPA